MPGQASAAAGKDGQMILSFQAGQEIRGYGTAVKIRPADGHS
jgi:hypothetical protein